MQMQPEALLCKEQVILSGARIRWTERQWKCVLCLDKSMLVFRKLWGSVPKNKKSILTVIREKPQPRCCGDASCPFLSSRSWLSLSNGVWKVCKYKQVNLTLNKLFWDHCPWYGWLPLYWNYQHAAIKENKYVFCPCFLPSVQFCLLLKNDISWKEPTVARLKFCIQWGENN